MIIKSLELKDYRSYDTLKIEFNENKNILVGNNAQGKTNILEAIYVSATSKSHRTSVDNELIKFDKNESHIKLNVYKNSMNIRVDMHLKKGKTKGIAVNGIPIKKTSELYGLVNIVFFSPEDLNLIKNGPKERRRFIDMELCQLDKIYYYNLQQYNKSLLQRNNLLKQIEYKKDLIKTIDLWDSQLSKFGKEIISQRKQFIRKLNDIVVGIHNKITSGQERLHIEYEPNTDEENYDRKLIENREKDIKLKTTSTGIHRDDIVFEINGIDIRKFGSQGQQRTAALSVKLAEIEIVKEIIDDYPILLLDDVMSELDRKRQNLLLNSIKKIQTIITCTGIEEFVENRIKTDEIFYVNGSKVTK